MRSLAVAVAGAVLFLWPFTGGALPASTPALATAVGVLLALLAVEMGTRRLDARTLALLAALAAVDAGLRMALVNGIGGFSPIFLLVLCAGWSFGPAYGFLAGASSLLVSALATGGVGPWLPYEMFATGWTGLAAGLVRRRGGAPVERRDVVLLAAVGIVCGYAYGAAMDVWDWTFFRASPGLGWQPGLAPLAALGRFAHYYVATSLVYDTLRAAGNALMVLAAGGPILLAMSRFRVRFRSEWVDEAEVDASPVVAAAAVAGADAPH